MTKSPLILLTLLFSFNVFSLTLKEIIVSENFKNDSIGMNINEMVEEHFKSNVVLMPYGIYDGYLPYVHELAPSDYSNNGKYREFTSKKSPEGYMLFINTRDWANYLEKNEPSFSANLKKYESLSESSKELFRRKYEAQLLELQKRDVAKGVYSFERAVVVSYLKVLGSDYVFRVSRNHYVDMISEFNAGIDDDPKFRMVLGEEKGIWIKMKLWKYYLDKYEILQDIKKVFTIGWNNNFDLKIDYNEQLSSEKGELERYQELLTWKKGVDSGEIFLNIEEYDKHLKEMQRQFPGKFQNSQRIKNQRKIELEKLEYYKNFEYEYCVAEESNMFPKDLQFKLARIEMLQYFLTSDYIVLTDLWYLNYPDFTIRKENAYKVEYYDDEYSSPKAIHFGERPKLIN